MPAFDPRAVPAEPMVQPPLPPVSIERLQPDALRARLRRPPAHWRPESTGDHVRLAGQGDRAPVPAAVLVPIVTHARPSVLLTHRAVHLSRHAGQVALPGGRSDPHDRHAEDTALREAQEEIGLPPSVVDVLGRLPDYLTATGYRVTPVIGLVPPDLTLVPDPSEVADTFEVPLDWLMDPATHRRHRVDLGDNASRTFYSMPWRVTVDGVEREHFIWGATAAMLRNLYRLLSA